jgi:ABC transporter transmembrane region 2/CBS domain
MTTQRKWREWLTKHLLASWLGDDNYRRLKFVTGEYQNAEYRISYDARIATDAPVDMALGLFAAALTAVVFIDVLWAVGGSLTVMVGPHEVTIPGYLVLGVCVYSFAFTTAMIAIGRQLPAIIQSENQAEAEMLAAATGIRERGEQAAPAVRELTERMLERKISGLPVVDAAGCVVGIVSEHDLLRRRETEGGTKRPHWLQLIIERSGLADEAGRFHVRTVGDVMTPNPVTVTDAAERDASFKARLIELERQALLHRMRLQR